MEVVRGKVGIGDCVVNGGMGENVLEWNYVGGIDDEMGWECMGENVGWVIGRYMRFECG